MPKALKASHGSLNTALIFQAHPSSRTPSMCLAAAAVATGITTKPRQGPPGSSGSVSLGTTTPGLAKRAAVLAGAAALSGSNSATLFVEKEATEEKVVETEQVYKADMEAEEVVLNMSTPGMSPRRVHEKAPLAFRTVSSPIASSRLNTPCSPAHKPAGLAPGELDLLREWLGQLERRMTLQEVCFTGAAAAETLQPLFAALALAKRGLTALERL